MNSTTLRLLPLLLCLPSLVFAHALEAPPAAALAVALPLAAWTALALAAVLYLRALQRRAPLSPRHAAAFALGWLSVALAVGGPLERAAADSFAAHMGQHELLMLIAPPLLILGRPYTALAASVPRRLLRLAAWPLRLPPLATWLLHAAALWVWHVPRLFDAGLAAPEVHAAQHASFFFSALLFWWTVFRRVRSGLAVMYVLTTLIHTGALAALLTFAPRPLYAGAALADQQLGGLLMWVPAGFALLAAGLVAFDRLLARQT